MLETNLIKERGIYDYDDATDLDNLAYKFYMIEVYEEGSMDKIYYTQQGFVGSVGCEQFYEKANQILRKLKINKIKDEIKN